MLNESTVRTLMQLIIREKEERCLQFNGMTQEINNDQEIPSQTAHL